MQDMVSPESKLSSMLESPPTVTDPTPDKGIKDFSRQYLHQGMWPSKNGDDKLKQAALNTSAKVKPYVLKAFSEKTYYPTMDANIVQKINSTIDNNSNFYFKRASEHVGNLSQLRCSQNISNILMHPANLTLANNTVVNSFDDMCNIHDQNQQTEQQARTSRSNQPHRLSCGSCKECQLEKEKRTVTQKAFERALGISLFLMEEIDKLSVKGQRNSNAEMMLVSRQEIANLVKTNYDNTRFLRSKSQNVMPPEIANLQRSL